MKKIIKFLAGTISVGVLGLLVLIIYVQCNLPDNLYVAQGEEVYIHSALSVVSVGKRELPFSMDLAVSDKNGNDYKIDFRLFQSVPIKQVQVQVVPRNMVVPGGMPFGIKMYTEGVMVVGMSDIQDGTQNRNPAKDAGLKIGDILTHIDDTKLVRNEDAKNCFANSGGNEVKISLNRSGQEMDLYLSPIKSEYDEGYKAGIWVRDSSAGIGTMTYYNPQSLGFAGLGHAICDIDTGNLMPLSTGEIVDVNISGANAGHTGKPGELRGSFVGSDPIGQLMMNTESGIFGVLSEDMSFDVEPIPIAMKQEIQAGPATILSTISGNKPQSFDIQIEKVNYADNTSTKNMVIKITDPELLAITGGIVQGMSGSPILQNGKLVGAVTHVFVNDPTRGYGIFAEIMEIQLNSVENTPNVA